MNDGKKHPPQEQTKDESVQVVAKQPFDTAQNASFIVENIAEFRYVKHRFGCAFNDLSS